MALSDRRILKAMRNGRVIITPFDIKNLSTSSYDVRLGTNFYREQEPRLKNSIFNIYNPEHVKRVWGEPQEAPFASEIVDLETDEYITPKDRVILLSPGETILAHTEEFIGGRYDITTMMKARSSTGRSFILVCKCAGWGDVGYTTRWTFEITNVSQHYHVPLLVGSRIAQIVFLKTGRIRKNDYTKTGAYQTSDNMNEVIGQWHPSSMLPKNRP